MTLRTRLSGLLASLTIVAIVVALPLVLLAVGANPIPTTWPSLDQTRAAAMSPDDGTLALGAIKLVAWGAWAFLTGSIVLEVLSRVRGVRVPRVPALAVPQAAARGLVGAAILLFAAAPVSHSPASAAPVVATSTAATVAASSAGHPTHVSRATTHAAPRAVALATPPRHQTPPTADYVVQRGDTLWAIAERHLGSGVRYTELVDLNRGRLGADPGFLTAGEVLQIPSEPARQTTSVEEHTETVKRGDTLWDLADEELGDPTRYPEIFEASRNTVQPDGRRLTDPDLIVPGWTLIVPAEQTAAVEKPAPRQTPEIAPHLKFTPTQGGTPSTTEKSPTPATRESVPQAAGPIDTSRPSQSVRDSTPAQTSEVVDVDDAGSDHASWMVTGLTGGGVMLAAAMLLALRRRRRAQLRHRRPGRIIAAPEPHLAPVERTLTVAGGPVSLDLERMDEALRRLASAGTALNAPMPMLAAVELRRHDLALHLSAPATLGDPWTGSDDRMHWTLAGTAAVDQVGALVPDQPAPYPLLVTVGSDDEGQVWLLNIEELALTVTGDPTFGRDFARYLAAEVACNPWSHGVTVDTVGVGHELEPMNPDRLRVPTDGLHAAAACLTHAASMIDRSSDAGVDVATARAHQDGADSWPARLLIADLTEYASRAAADSSVPGIDKLLDFLHDNSRQTGASVLLLEDGRREHGVELHFTDDGRVRLPHVGLDLVAVGLTSDEARGCAALLAQGEELADAPMPVDEIASDGWRAWSDEAGSLRHEHTIARDDVEDHTGPSSSLLDHSDESYLEVCATTREDLAELAPFVPERVGDAVRDSDPTLDEDLAMWWSDDCPLPRLTLLGPVGARTRGTPVTKRKPYYTEMLAFVALRPHGATPDELADAFSLSPGKARDYARIVRDWLGTNPRNGKPHLPDARQSPAAKTQGVSVYQVLDLLVDVDLFRRLRVRGESRGPDGVHDLCEALRLVQGRPFDRLRDGGWSFLSSGDRLDHHITCAIVDVAHLVTTFSLEAGDIRKARLAAETANLAAPYEEIPKLDLAAVADAEGDHAEADRILREDVCNRTDDDDAPPEISDRTRRIVAARAWRERTRKAG
ncbi:LysM peptidoglycan-binding domain-containing protein [Phycicoccus jejuensis]|uniref:LysM peptidoglycan-binding domain-containing protein n=1 Tax=Phycicoccus jejuensis TaxID=367299 RepID=UPI00384C7715